MSVLELYFRTKLSLDELAQTICKSLCVGRCEQREGVNRGGMYFEMQVFGLTLELLSNQGEVEIPERAEWQYYMLVHSDEMQLDEEDLRGLCLRAASLIKREGVETEIDCLS